MKCRFNQIVKRLVENGVVYIGSSAGSVLAGPTIETMKILDTHYKIIEV